MAHKMREPDWMRYGEKGNHSEKISVCCQVDNTGGYFNFVFCFLITGRLKWHIGFLFNKTT